MKVIILTALPFSKQLLLDFHFHTLNKVFDVELWSFKNMLMKDYQMPDQTYNCYEINSEEEFKRKIELLKKKP